MKPEDAENRAGTPIKQLSFFTAAKIAKWMAKSYGYRATKKHEYTSQDQVDNPTPPSFFPKKKKSW